MSKKVNQNELIKMKNGPIWSVRVVVYSHLLEGSRISKVQKKRWKVKEILN